MLSTIELFGLRALERAAAGDYAEWATGMLTSGFDSKHLRMLAGFASTDSTFEAADIFQKTLTELELIEPPREAALRDNALFYAAQLVSGSLSPRVGTSKLSSLYIQSNDDPALSVWYNLHHACSDIEYGDYPYSYPELTKENLEQTILQEATAFIKEYHCPKSTPSHKGGLNEPGVSMPLPVMVAGLGFSALTLLGCCILLYFLLAATNSLQVLWVLLIAVPPTAFCGFTAWCTFIKPKPWVRLLVVYGCAFLLLLTVTYQISKLILGLPLNLSSLIDWIECLLYGYLLGSFSFSTKVLQYYRIRKGSSGSGLTF